MTREQVAALLYRYFNLTEDKNYQNPYGDVSEDSTSYIKGEIFLTSMGTLDRMQKWHKFLQMLFI